MIVILGALVIKDKFFQGKIKHRKYQLRAKNYEGNLERNVSHPLDTE